MSSLPTSTGAGGSSRPYQSRQRSASPPAWTEDSLGLGKSTQGVEPDEGIADEDGVNGGVLQRDRLREAAARVAIDIGPHVVVRLDCDHDGHACPKRPREDAGAGRKVEHRRLAAEAQCGHA